MMTTVSIIGQKLWVSLGKKVNTQMASGSAPYIKTQ